MRGTARVVMSDVEALAAACAGGHVEKVESLLAKGTCVVTRVQWAFSLGSARIDFPARAGRIPRGSDPSLFSSPRVADDARPGGSTCAITHVRGVTII